MVRIYTRTGDKGETGLLYGGRVPKNHPRCEAYGALDEAVSAMGLARSLSSSPRLRDVLLRVQRQLFTLSAELATATEQRHLLEKHFSVVTAQMVADLETLIDGLQSSMSMPRAFIVPGGSPASAAMDLARSMLRTAERRVVDLHQRGMLGNDEVLRYVNRAADLLFVLARYEDKDLPVELATGGQGAADP